MSDHAAPVPHRIRDAEWAETDTPSGKLTYHVVTDDTRGVVNVPGGRQDVVPGDVLVASPNSDVYYVYSAGAFDYLPGNAAEQDDHATASDKGAVDTSNASDFDPSDNSATRVRRMVAALVAEGNYDEAQRIVSEEREDKNRNTAVPQSYANWEGSNGGE